MYKAKLYITKYVEKDNYFNGCDGMRTITFTDTHYVDFSDVDDLKKGMAEYLSANFDINFEVAFILLDNECDSCRFDYSQSENGEAFQMDITLDNQDGYNASYELYVSEVYVIVDYKFENGVEL